MDFSLTDEQAMLRESVEQFVTKAYDFERRQAFSAMPQGFSPDNWQQFAELGWLAIPFAEDDGGFDGGPVETMLMMQEFGKGLVVEPYLATIVLAGGALRRSPNTGLRARLLPSIIDGSLQAAFAYAEVGGGFNLADVSTSATKSGDGYVINGGKTAVCNAAAADYLLVSARTSGGRRDEQGISLFCVAAGANGLTRTSYPTVDGLHAAEVSFTNTPAAAADLVAPAGAALPLIRAVIDEATLAVSAEAVGILEMLNTKTLEYTRSREQFGRSLSGFQALQHRMVDMFMEFEQTRSLLLMAAIRAGEDSGDAGRAIAALKYQVGTAGRRIGQEAVQLHGGMGVTNELDVAHYFKRLTTIDTLFGNADYQLARFQAADAAETRQAPRAVENISAGANA